MPQVTNLDFFHARRGQSEALGAALAALVEPHLHDGSQVQIRRKFNIP
jgi:hypothetical protein